MFIARRVSCITTTPVRSTGHSLPKQQACEHLVSATIYIFKQFVECLVAFQLLPLHTTQPVRTRRLRCPAHISYICTYLQLGGGVPIDWVPSTAPVRYTGYPHCPSCRGVPSCKNYMPSTLPGAAGQKRGGQRGHLDPSRFSSGWSWGMQVQRPRPLRMFQPRVIINEQHN